LQTDTRNIKNYKSVSNNEHHQLFDRTSPDFSIKISNSFEGSSKECFTDIENQSSAIDVSE